MPEPDRVEINGKSHRLLRVAINQQNEPWNEYHLDDGTVIRRKMVATGIFRAEEGYEPDGTPIYVVMGKWVHDVRALPDTKKKQAP